jgi:hypothetical protein
MLKADCCQLSVCCIFATQFIARYRATTANILLNSYYTPYKNLAEAVGFEPTEHRVTVLASFQD